MEVSLTVGVRVPTTKTTKMGILQHRSTSSSLYASSCFCGRWNISYQRLSHRMRNTTCRVSCSQVELEGDVDDEACELVNGVELILGEGKDTFRACLFTAVKNNNGTGILLLSDVHGYEASSTRDFAYRVACNGYNVLVPDLFRGNPWNKNLPRSEFDGWVARQPAERVTKDINTSAKWLIEEFKAVGIYEKLGIIGFCFGGGCLIQALAHDPEANFSTAVCFYGTHMDLSLASKITSPVLFISGDSDPHCSISTLHDLEKNIGRGSSVVVFEGRGHAFVHRPGSPEEDSDAEQAFLLMRNWLQDGLFVNKAQ